MRIEVEKNTFYMYPENEADIFLLGKLTMKFIKSSTEFISTTDNEKPRLQYLEVKEDVMLKYLNESHLNS